MAISTCGVYNCGSCSQIRMGRCPGCCEGNRIMVADRVNPCPIYLCAQARGMVSCTDCAASDCPYPRRLDMGCPVRDHFDRKRSQRRQRTEGLRDRSDLPRAPLRDIKVSEKSVTRLSWYLSALDDLQSRGVTRVSSNDISMRVGVKDYLIRHDLSSFGKLGRPSIGYNTASLRSHLIRALHLDDEKKVLWVGASVLAERASLIERLASCGFAIVAVLDTRVESAPREVGGLRVYPLGAARELIRQSGAQGAMLAVNPAEAQAVADILVGLGIRSVLNLTSAVIVVPEDVCLRNVDIVAEMVALSFSAAILFTTKSGKHGNCG